MMISERQLNALREVERDLTLLPAQSEQLCKDRQTMHEILNSIDPQPKPRFDTVDWIIRFEQGELTNEEVILLFQNLITSGAVWSLQGSYHRLARDLINAGYCTA